MDFPAEIEHAFKTCKGNLPLMVVIAEGDAHLIRDRPFLDAADQEIQPVSPS